MFFRPLAHYKKKAIARVVSIFVPSLIFDLDAAYHPSVPANNIYISTTEGSNYFPTNSYLTGGTAITLGQTCTFECWFRTTSDPASSKFVLLGGNGNRGLTIYNGTYGQSNYSATVIRLDFETAGDVGFTVPTMSANTWYHLAVTFNAGVATLWLNGTRSSTGTSNTGWTFLNQIHRIGAWTTQAIYSQNVYISNVRITNTAVYDVTQTSITVPTGPLPKITGTLLLLNNATSATANTDSSDTAMTMTPSGTMSWSNITPFTTAGNYQLTSNAGSSLTWNSANGGTFAKSNSTGTDYIIGGPNYATGQSYTVFMAYKLSATSAGRLLNTQSEASKDWLMGAYNGNPDTFYPNFTVNLPSSGADTVWHFGWATWDTGTSTGKLYTATSVAPSTYSYTATNGGGGGFNQLRLFSRSSGSEVQSGNIGFVKVYDGVLDITTIQSLHATYKARFGY
jgi:Concanavalin A-like lectin/glucanases superfamily